MKENDINAIISVFLEKHDENDRFSSFDYCFNYFNPKNTACITDDIEISCLTRGFYLASWGMFRGSSFLLNKSVLAFQPVINYVASLDDSVWEIDAHNLTDHIDILLEIYQEINRLLIPSGKAHLTLTTKIMLGVFGSIPAYDRFFKASFSKIYKGKCGFTVFNRNSLECINHFYLANKAEIDQKTKTLQTLRFDNSGISCNFTKSKIIDMYGFSKGLIE